MKLFLASMFAIWLLTSCFLVKFTLFVSKEANVSEHRALAFQAAYEGLARTVQGRVDSAFVCKAR